MSSSDIHIRDIRQRFIDGVPLTYPTFCGVSVIYRDLIYRPAVARVPLDDLCDGCVFVMFLQAAEEANG